MSLDHVRRAVIVGFGRTGRGVARVLRHRGVELIAIDDAPGASARQAAGALDLELLETPVEPALSALLERADLIVVSPGVPPHHPIFSAQHHAEVLSEIELASRLTTRPIVAITGTNGKTTTTALVAAMLERSGQRTRAVGNFGPTLVEATEDDLDVYCAEVSSFQLALTREFRPAVATFLNIAEDHLDWHGDFADYLAAKTRIFANQGPDDVAVANAEEPLVLAAARSGRARLVTFGRDEGEYHLEGDAFVSPEDAVLARRGELARALPHDELNALAALATAGAAGASPEACRAALRDFTLLPHRVSPVGEVDGVTYYDDSKATTPSATIAALAGFSSSVLICGGRNKGLDLSEIARHLAAHPERSVRGVVAIGEAADEVAAAFTGYSLRHARTMHDAVAAARALARAGDAVLLSPACASFDWYRSYEERGEDFARCVAALEGPSAMPARSRA